MPSIFACFQRSMSNLLRTAVLRAAADLCPIKATGRPRTDHLELLDSFMTVLQTGMQWRIDFRTAHRHFIHWARAGVFELAYCRLYRLTSRETRKENFAAIDTTFIKSIYGREVVGPNPTDRGRMATKMLAVVNKDGLPQKLAFFPGNVSDHTTLKGALPTKSSARKTKVYADKG